MKTTPERQAAPDASVTVPAPLLPLLPDMLADAARRSGVAADRLRVASVEAVTWRDGSLGCPQPGMLYPQVLIAGWRVRIALPIGEPLHYHVGARGQWLWGAPGRAVEPLPAGADPRI